MSIAYKFLYPLSLVSLCFGYQTTSLFLFVLGTILEDGIRYLTRNSKPRCSLNKQNGSFTLKFMIESNNYELVIPKECLIKSSILAMSRDDGNVTETIKAMLGPNNNFFGMPVTLHHLGIKAPVTIWINKKRFKITKSHQPISFEVESSGYVSSD